MWTVSVSILWRNLLSSFLAALFESTQFALEHENDCPSHWGKFGSDRLSDELRRAETTPTITFRLRRALASLKILRVMEPTILLNITTQIRRTLISVREFLGTLDHVRLSSRLRHTSESPSLRVFLELTLSHFLKRSVIESIHFLASFLGRPRLAITGFQASLHLSARKMFARLIVMILAFTFFLIICLFIHSIQSRDRLESHTTPRRIRRIQRNLNYHLDNDL